MVGGRYFGEVIAGTNCGGSGSVGGSWTGGKHICFYSDNMAVVVTQKTALDPLVL